MPVRSVRVHIYNESSYLTMQQTALQSCSGSWTDGWALPAASIASGHDSLFQAESDGIATGAIGYIKYDLIAANGKHGMVYLYWDNPYMGVTSFKIATNVQDVPADCGPGSGDNSTFSESGNMDFTVAYASGDQDGGNAMNDSPLQTLGNTAAAGLITPIAMLVGQVGIIAHAWVEMHVRDQEPRGLSSTPPAQYTFSDRTNAVPGDWVGHWSGQGIDVQVSAAANEKTAISVKLVDSSTRPPLSITETVSLVEIHPPVAKELGTLLPGVKTAGVEISPSTGASSKSSAHLAMKQPVSAARVAGEKAAATDKAAQSSSTGESQHMEKISPVLSSESASEIAHYKDAISLGSGVVLTLMNAKVDGKPAGLAVRYQRHSKTPPVSTDINLLRYVPPPR